MSSNDSSVYLAARASSSQGISSSMRLQQVRSRVIYINETNRKNNSQPVPHNNSYTFNTSSAKEGRQYFTQSELQSLLPQSLTQQYAGNS
jgi:hypothetical protein